MTILSAHHSSRIRNAALSALHYIAYDQNCEVSDILALITPSQPPQSSQAPAARTSVPATPDVQAEVAAPQPSATPFVDVDPDNIDDDTEADIPAFLRPQPTSTPAVQEHIDDTVSNGLVERPTSPPGAEGSAVPAPIKAHGDAALRDPLDIEDEDGAQPAPGITPEASKPLPDDQNMHRPAEAKTSDQADGGAVSAVKGKARLENAVGVEPPPSEPPSKPRRGRPASISTKVAACHAENPSWPPKLIADHLGITEDSVRACASRNKLTLGTWKDYQASLPESERAEPVRAVPAEPTKRDRVREAHAAHPDFSAKDLATHLGMDELNLRAVASQIGIKLPKAKSITPSARVTLADKIRAHLVNHPNATVGEISAATGHRLQAIGWAAQKAGITLRKRTAEERSEASRRSSPARQQKPQELVERAGPATPRAEPQRQPAAIPAAPAYVPAPRPKQMSPTQTFYVRDQSGRFVHYSLTPSPTSEGPLMTSNRHEAWKPTSQQFRNVKERWPQIVMMKKELPQ